MVIDGLRRVRKVNAAARYFLMSKYRPVPSLAIFCSHATQHGAGAAKPSAVRMNLIFLPELSNQRSWDVGDVKAAKLLAMAAADITKLNPRGR